MANTVQYLTVQQNVMAHNSVPYCIAKPNDTHNAVPYCMAKLIGTHNAAP